MTQALTPDRPTPPPGPPGSPGSAAATGSRVVRSISRRMAVNRVFVWLCLASTGLAMLILAVLLLSVLVQGVGTLDLQFIRSLNSSDPNKAGIFSGLVGTILLCSICAATAIPLGVGTAILIEEFRPRNLVLLKLHGFVETNIRNLAGVPSIVYGILGVTAFATMAGLFGDMGAGKFAIGQTWYEEYIAEDRTPYYTPTTRGVDPAPASAGMTFYTAMGGGEAANLTFMSAEEAEPRREAIESEMDAFERSLRDGIKSVRGPRGRGAATVDQEAAERIVDDAIAAGTWESDPAQLREDLIPMVLKLDGVEGTRELVLVRSDIIKTAVNREYTTRMAGMMMEGKPPVRRDKKAWYYLALPFGRGVMAGGLTLMLVILPIVIVASQEALRAVPESYRQGALAMGSTRWQSVSKTALPAAIPGICTGTILAISRAIGEAAPLLIIGAAGYITSTPKNPMDSFSAMPIQIYHWTSEPDLHYQQLAASGIIVLLAVLLTFNAIAITIRQRATRHH